MKNKDKSTIYVQLHQLTATEETVISMKIRQICVYIHVALSKEPLVSMGTFAEFIVLELELELENDLLV